MPRTVEEHQRVVDALIPDLPPIAVPLDAALGLVLAADVVARVDLPPFDNSAMDGYAALAADLNKLPVSLPVAADVPAGATPPGPLAPGTVVRIMTGAPTPPNTEVIVPVEGTDAGIARVTINSAPPPGVHIRRHGEDVRTGAVVLTAGTPVGPTQVGVAAALGAAQLNVRRAPRVLILSTGSELASPGTPLKPGQIFESNAPMLAAAVRAIGADPVVLRFVPDDVDAFTATLESAASGVDLIVTTGGVSAGAYEVVKDALAGRGVEFVKVSMQPGGPQGAGLFNGVPIVTFPGNPVSAFVSFEVFLRPVLLRALGFPVTTRPILRLPISVAVESPPGRRQFRRAVHDERGVRPWGGPGSHLLSWLAGADSMLVVPEDTTRLAPGDDVEVWLFDRG